MSFESLGLRSELLRAVSEKGYNTPTPIQLQAIPLILEGRDIMGGAQTGTGKTAGFTLPLLQRLMATAAVENSHRPIRALVLTPTRELAAQVAESVQNYGKYLPLRSTVIYGGVSINPQKDKLRKGVDILVATPGRLLDHVGQRTVNLSKIEILVLDEADRMLDMGFIHDIRKVLALLPKQKQTLFFSATFPEEIKRLAKDLLKSPVQVEATQRNTAPELVTQIVHPVDKGQKRPLLSYLIGSNNWKQVLVFTRTKHGANRLAEQLNDDGVTAAAIHGNKTQGARTRALADFKCGNIRALVATDIAARGLDINQLPHVVNFELPHVPEDYVHRIGRTGRAGNEGVAMSLVCVDELGLLKDIERLTKRDIPKRVIEGFEPNLSIKAEPISRGRGKQQQDARRPREKKVESSRNDQRPHFKSRPNEQASTQDKGRNQSRNQPRNQSQGRPQNSSDGRSRNQSPHQIQERSSGRTESRSQNRGQQQHGDRSQDRTQHQSRNSSRAQPLHNQSRNQSRHQTKERSSGRTESHSQNRAQPQHGDRSQERTQNQSPNSSRARPHNQSRNRSENQSPRQSKGQPQGRPQRHSEGRSQAQPREQSRNRPRHTSQAR